MGSIQTLRSQLEVCVGFFICSSNRSLFFGVEGTMEIHGFIQTEQNSEVVEGRSC